MKIVAKICLILLALASPISILRAHQTGASWEKIVGDYKVDVGYDPTTFVADQPERLDFNLIDTKTGQSVPFSDVWVRISKDQETVFASGIHKLTYGLTGMIFDFPKSGDFNLNVRFENEDSTIVQTDFPISVNAGESQSVTSFPKPPIWVILITGFICLLVGAGMVGFIRRK